MKATDFNVGEIQKLQSDRLSKAVAELLSTCSVCAIVGALAVGMLLVPCGAELSPIIGGDAATGFFQSIFWYPNNPGENTVARQGTSWNRTLSVVRVGPDDSTLWRFTWGFQHLASDTSESDGQSLSGVFDYDVASGTNGFVSATVCHGEGADRMELLVNYRGFSSRLDVYFSAKHLPRLNISYSGSGTVQVTWSTNFTNFTLEQASNLTTASWSTVMEDVSIVGNQYFVALPVNEYRLFRLRKNL